MPVPKTDVHIELHVPNFKKAIEFYKILGFKVVWMDDRYLVMRRKRAFLSFNEGSSRVYEQSYFKNFPQTTKRGYAVEVIIPITSIKLFFAKVKDKVKVVQPLLLKRWGKYDFRVEDPFGFYLRFTEPFDWINDGKKIKGTKKFLK